MSSEDLFEPALQFFGKVVTEIMLLRDISAQSAAHLARYCGGTLKVLKALNAPPFERNCGHVERLFANLMTLKVLKMNNGWIPFDKCVNLEHLEIKSCNSIKDYIESCTFPCLRSLGDYVIREPHFVWRHPRLSNIHIVNFHEFADDLVELRKLQLLNVWKFDPGHAKSQRLAELRHLKCLSVSIVNKGFGGILRRNDAMMQSLEALFMAFEADAKPDWGVLAKMRGLKRLGVIYLGSSLDIAGGFGKFLKRSQSRGLKVVDVRTLLGEFDYVERLRIDATCRRRGIELTIQRLGERSQSPIST